MLTIIRLAMAIGKSTFQPRFMTWSYLNLGSVNLTQIKKKRNASTLPIKTSGGRNQYLSMSMPNQPPKGSGYHPPKKSATSSHDTTIMCVYSAMKNMANFMLLYSV